MLTKIEWRTPVHSGKKAKSSHALSPDPKAYLCGAYRRFMPRCNRYADEQPTGQPRCETCAELIKTAIA
jgi:hypothetical protein